MAQQNMNAVFYATTYHPIQAGSIDGTDTASHDNGVYRALVASTTGLYDPTGDPKAEGDPYATLFVGQLARHTTEKTLHEAMSKYGRVTHLRLVRHIVTGASRGYAFVEFETENDMQYAYEMAQHHIIDGSPILVDYNRQPLMPGWIPRRLGGGLGGHKESGQLRFGGRDRPFRAPLRPIPSEQLIKLGIPLPPVGRYVSRFQLPSIPRRLGSLKEGSYYKQRSSYKQSPSLDLPAKTLAGKDRVELEHHAVFSPRLGKRPADAERGSSTAKEHRVRQTAAGEVEESLSDKRNHGQEDESHHKKRRRSEHRDEHFDRQKLTRSGHEDRGSSRHHKRSTSGSGYKDRDSGHHEGSSRWSWRKDEASDHHQDRPTSRTGQKDRDSGHYHKGERKTRERSADYDRSAEYDRSPNYGSGEIRQSRAKHRKRDN